MIDLHCHILPGIDDGCDSLNDSLEMANYAVKQGITDILCTPHHNNGMYVNPRSEVIEEVAKLQETLNLYKIPLQLHAGQEVRITDTIVEEIKAGRILGTDDSNRYILIEFPTGDVPMYSPFLFEELFKIGRIPMIVHPERNAHFRHHPNDLLNFLDMGCVAQLTAPSYVGVFGKSIQKTAKLMVEHNLVQTMASDAHGLHKRNIYMKEAYEAMEKDFGREKVAMMKRITNNLLLGEDIVMPDYSTI